MTRDFPEGGCPCRAIRYRVTGEPPATSLCHCRTCRVAARAPSVAWVVRRSSESSPGVRRTFCSRCGTSLTCQRELEPGTIDVTTATLDTADAFAPTREIRTAQRLAWESINGSLRQYPGSSRQSTG